METAPVLRPYQQATIDLLLSRLESGRKAPLVVLPTGAGKTVLIVTLTGRHLARSEAHRVLVVAHRRELISQAADRLRAAGIDVEELHPDAEPNPGARVVVASIQTLLARGEFPPATLVIFDEAHHYAADDWSELTKAYADAIRIGFTATPCRSDGRGLSPAFDSLAVGATIKQLTELGHLVPCRVIAPERPLRSRQLVCTPLDAYRQHASGRRTVVFAEFVADAQQFREDFVTAGINAVVVHGEMPHVEREQALRAHREGGAVLINVMVLTEGWDSPETSVCILARGCGSVGTYLQIVGRVLRPAPGKAEALVVDLTGRAFHTHGSPDEEREFSLIGKGIRAKNRSNGSTCFVCGSLVDSWPCDVCGHEPEGGVREEIRIVGGDLAVRYAEKRSEDSDTQIDTLARWIAEARARGWKEWSAVRKYGHVYGRQPCLSFVTEARARARTITTAECATCHLPTVRTYRGGQCGKCAFGSQKGAA